MTGSNVDLFTLCLAYVRAKVDIVLAYDGKTEELVIAWECRG